MRWVGCWGCSFNCTRTEQYPKKHEIKPPGLDFTHAVANGT
jgi:hypothetical protein